MAAARMLYYILKSYNYTFDILIIRIRKLHNILQFDGLVYVLY